MIGYSGEVEYFRALHEAAGDFSMPYADFERLAVRRAEYIELLKRFEPLQEFRRRFGLPSLPWWVDHAFLPRVYAEAECVVTVCRAEEDSEDLDRLQRDPAAVAPPWSDPNHDILGDIIEAKKLARKAYQQSEGSTPLGSK